MKNVTGETNNTYGEDVMPKEEGKASGETVGACMEFNSYLRRTSDLPNADVQLIMEELQRWTEMLSRRHGYHQ